MGQLAGFSYREIVKRLKELGLKFRSHAADSHEIWFNQALKRYTTIPNRPGDMPEGTLRAILRQAGRAPHPSNSHTQSSLYPQLIGPIRQTLLDLARLVCIRMILQVISLARLRGSIGAHTPD